MMHLDALVSFAHRLKSALCNISPRAPKHKNTWWCYQTYAFVNGLKADIPADRAATATALAPRDELWQAPQVS